MIKSFVKSKLQTGGLEVKSFFKMSNAIHTYSYQTKGMLDLIKFMNPWILVVYLGMKQCRKLGFSYILCN